MSKAMEVLNETPAEISRVAVRLPSYAEGPDAWFVLAKVQFTLAGITEERTTFYCVLSQLDDRYVRELREHRPRSRNPNYSNRRSSSRNRSPAPVNRSHSRDGTTTMLVP
jgi:hypothetical protein